MEVLVFNDKDLKKDGTLKKRNNARLYPKEDFKKLEEWRRKNRG